MSHGGKGDKPRPYSVPLAEFDNRWDNIFGKKKSTNQEESKDQNEGTLDREIPPKEGK
jgi:hypothetical protein